MYDRNFIADLYDHHAKDLIVFIYSYVKSQQAAEDVLHDVFVKLMVYSRKKVLHRLNPRALLYSIARTLSIDYLRKNRRMVDAPVEDTPVSGNPVHDELEKKEIRKGIEEALNRMKRNTSSVYIMRTELGMGFTDIAVNLGISERTAKREMQRALSIIADRLEKSGFISFNSVVLAFLTIAIVLR